MVGLILAGGQGTRLGREKTGLRLGRETLLERAVRRVRPLFSRVLVSVAGDTALDLPGVAVVADAYPGRSALVGLASGLKAAGEAVFVLAVDMPFLNPDLIRYMADLAPGGDAVVPRVKDYLEPLHAVYQPRCLAFMEELIRAGEHQIFQFYHRVNIRWVEEDELRRLDPEGLAFFNINTPDDLRRAEELIKQGK